MEAIIPTLGLGTSCHVEATALFPYRPTMEQHLSFEKGETIYVSEQQVIKYIYNDYTIYIYTRVCARACACVCVFHKIYTFHYFI